MAKYELSLARDYVPDWTIVDAVRELFQNALDQQSSSEGDNDMYFAYDAELKKLSIGNRLSVLDTSSLLLGSSSKRDDERTIGQFGEGYKVATLVLLREGKNVVFYNYGNRQVWKPRFVKSRRYKRDILTFFVDNKFPWATVPDNNLTIEIEGITEDEYELIVQSNLHLTTPDLVIETPIGRILLDDDLKGKVFVNGLFVSYYDKYEKGYDFLPEHLKLDRDRKLVSDFDLKWLASKMWSQESKQSKLQDKVASELLLKNAADVEYIIQANSSTADKLVDIASKVHKQFVTHHGQEAFPVTSTNDMVGLSTSVKPVIVSDTLRNIMRMSTMYKEPVRAVQLTLVDKLELWYGQWNKKMHPQAAEQIKALIEGEKEKENGQGKNIQF